MATAVESKTNWQYTSDGVWDEGNHISFTDKLCGLEIRWLQVGEGESIMIPVDQVPSLIRALIRFSTDGGIAIAKGDG